MVDVVNYLFNDWKLSFKKVKWWYFGVIEGIYGANQSGKGNWWNENYEEVRDALCGQSMEGLKGGGVWLNGTIEWP